MKFKRQPLAIKSLLIGFACVLIVFLSVLSGEIASAKYPTESCCVLTSTCAFIPVPEVSATARALATTYRTTLDKELDAKNVQIDKDTEKKVKKLLENGAKEVESYGATPGLRREADANMKRFAAELVKNAETSNGNLTVTKRSLQMSLSICPLWPICK